MAGEQDSGERKFFDMTKAAHDAAFRDLPPEAARALEECKPLLARIGERNFSQMMLFGLTEGEELVLLDLWRE